MALFSVLILVVFLISFQMEALAQLQVGFYRNTCGVAETIVRVEVQRAFARDAGIAPGLIRMHFHNCFVRGCDASILISSTSSNAAEVDGPPNGITLRGYEVIESAKTRLEAACPGVVSCADILAFAARDSVVVTGGFGWDVPAGRRDGRVSLATETSDIPAPFFNLDQITQSFAKKGLSQDDMVALVGVHTVGRSHCFQFTERLYNFNSAHSQDPSLDLRYAAELKLLCPRNSDGSIDANLVVQMNPTPALMDNSYYALVLQHSGLFTSDQSLTTIPETSSQLRLYAKNYLIWQYDFVRAMIKMGQVGVSTGSAGEIRFNCRKVNS